MSERKRPEYAPYQPDCSERPVLPADLWLGHARLEDVPGLTALALARNGGEAVRHEQQFQAEIERFQSVSEPESLLFVARLAGQPVAYARLRQIRELGPTDLPAPLGWYALGLVVSPLWRRCGLASALSQQRFDWLQDRGIERLYSFVNLQNRASLRLHEQLGFVLQAEAEGFLWVRFTGGRGGLFYRKIS